MALHKPEHKTVKYWLLWLPLSLGYVLLLPYGWITGRSPSDREKMQWSKKWYQDLEDYIDDPIDWLKQKLFGIGKLP